MLILLLLASGRGGATLGEFAPPALHDWIPGEDNGASALLRVRQLEGKKSMSSAHGLGPRDQRSPRSSYLSSLSADARSALLHQLAGDEGNGTDAHQSPKARLRHFAGLRAAAGQNVLSQDEERDNCGGLEEFHQVVLLHVFFEVVIRAIDTFDGIVITRSVQIKQFTCPLPFPFISAG